MSLEIRKNSRWWYGTFVVNGKKTVVNLGVPIICSYEVSGDGRGGSLNRATLSRETPQKRVRTMNLLARLSSEGKRRSKAIPRFMNEKSRLNVSFAVWVDAWAGRRGVKITPAISRELGAIRTNFKRQPGVRPAL